MNIHKNAHLTPKGRELLIARLERGEHPCDIACALGVSVRTDINLLLRHAGVSFEPGHFQLRLNHPVFVANKTLIVEKIDTFSVGCSLTTTCVLPFRPSSML